VYLPVQEWRISAVQTSNLQTFNNMIMLQVLFDDFIKVAFVYIGVPHPFRIHHYDRSFFASAHATCGIYADTVRVCGDRQGLDPVLDVITHILRIEIIATVLTLFALIGAEKYMFLVVTHEIALRLQGIIIPPSRTGFVHATGKSAAIAGTTA
jgi:hypothetical protein